DRAPQHSLVNAPPSDPQVDTWRQGKSTHPPASSVIGRYHSRADLIPSNRRTAAELGFRVEAIKTHRRCPSAATPTDATGADREESARKRILAVCQIGNRDIELQGSRRASHHVTTPDGN